MDINVGGETINIPERAVQYFESILPELPSDLQHSINTNPALKRCVMQITAIYMERGEERVSRLIELIEEIMAEDV